MPTLIEISFAFLLRLPLLAFGLLLAIAAGEAVLRAPLVLLFSAPIIAISVLVGLFSPFRLIKQRSDAKRINAWQPESIEGLSISSEIDGTISEELLLENILIPVPLKTEVALACFVGFPITALGVLLAILFTGGGSGALLSGAPLYGVMILFGIWFPLRKMKQRYDAIRINAWKVEE